MKPWIGKYFILFKFLKFCKECVVLVFVDKHEDAFIRGMRSKSRGPYGRNDASQSQRNIHGDHVTRVRSGLF